jgi:uncharacterized protein YndB with AHSA1/START domain
LVIERSIWINAPRERVWQAVTDPAQIAQWFAPGTEISQRDNKIVVRMGEMDIEVAVIEKVDPPHQLVTRGLPEMTITTTYTLEEENGGTRFTVTEAGLENLPVDARQKRMEQDGAGWEMALDNLNAFIQSKPLPHPQGF